MIQLPIILDLNRSKKSVGLILQKLSTLSEIQEFMAQITKNSLILDKYVQNFTVSSSRFLRS